SCTRVTQEDLPAQAPPRGRIAQIDHDSIRALVAVGVPVRGADAVALAGVSVSMPGVRYDPGRLQSLVATLNSAARAMEADLAARALRWASGASPAGPSWLVAPVNALDRLGREWAYEAVGFSYGGVPAGLRAAQQLEQVVTMRRMSPVTDAMSIPFVAVAPNPAN
ncbi:hypothetical protein ACWD4J_39805, partial [Streptomyces sp. NPDC002577]